ncbi:MAG TPA: hypothetical protein VGJ63_01820 [Micromonosporaceae bacterium]|jgi:predicted amidohydrolase
MGTTQSPLIDGGSLIVSPLGKVLAGPLCGEEGVLVARLNLAKYRSPDSTSTWSVTTPGLTCLLSASMTGPDQAC